MNNNKMGRVLVFGLLCLSAMSNSKLLAFGSPTGEGPGSSSSSPLCDISDPGQRLCWPQSWWDCYDLRLLKRMPFFAYTMRPESVDWEQMPYIPDPDHGKNLKCLMF